MSRRLLALPLVFALAATAVAQDAAVDPEERFHRAYETEVIDGRLADAARVYLTLIDDPKAPDRIRAESRFRFAVTAVLLGRADEARALLAALSDDAAVPESLRKRARSYLDATQGIGLGSELDRKLQSLVFELGRTEDTTEAPGVYRDFEVIGAPAVPFLRNLLTHPDATIRAHAFHILVRMGVPGMGGAWTAQATRDYPEDEFSAYLKARPEESAAWEKNVLGLDPAALRTVMDDSDIEVPVSAALLRAAREAGVSPSRIGWLCVAGVARDESVWLLCREWIRDAKSPYAEPAVRALLRAGAGPSAIDDDVALFRDVTAALATADLGWNVRAIRDGTATHVRERVPGDSAAYIALALRCPPEVLVEVLDSLVPAASPEDDAFLALRNGPFDALACAIEDRKPGEAALARFADILCRTAEAWGSRGARPDQGDFPGAVAAHLADVLQRLPAAGAAERLGRLVRSPLSATWSYGVAAMRASTVRDWEIAAQLLPGATATRSEALLRGQGLLGTPPAGRADDARDAAILAAYPGILATAVAEGRSYGDPLVRAFHQRLGAAPLDAARAALVGAVEAVAATRTDRTERTLRACVDPGKESDAELRRWTEVVVSAADRIWPRLPSAARTSLLANLCRFLDDTRVAACVARHAADGSSAVSEKLALEAPRIRLESWVPQLAPSAVGTVTWNVPQDVVAASLAAMAPDPAKASDTVIAFAYRTGAAGAAFLDRVLREGPADRVAEVFEYVCPGDPVSDDALRAGLDRLMASDANLPALRRAVAVLATQAPSPRLFPAVRRVMAAGAKADVVLAVQTAQMLGSPELLPALASLLDSLDGDVRAAAQTAIAKIRELEAMRTEARQGAAERAAPGGR